MLVNALGHSAGVLIFGIFLYLLIQDRAARRLAGSTKSMLAAALALLWNLASLIVLGADSSSQLATVMAAIGFSVLSLLPAVLFDLCLQERFRVLVRLGYGLSAVTIVLHVAELFHDSSQYHRWGLTLITIGYGALTCIAAVARIHFARRQFPRRTPRHDFAAGRHHVAVSARDVVRAFQQRRRDAGLVARTGVSSRGDSAGAADPACRIIDSSCSTRFCDFSRTFFWPRSSRSERSKPGDSICRIGPSTPFYQALLLTGACLLVDRVRGAAQLACRELLTRLVFRSPDREALLAKLKTPISR